MSIDSYLRGVIIFLPYYLFFPRTRCSNFLVYTTIHLVAIVRYVLQSLKCSIEPKVYISTSSRHSVFSNVFNYLKINYYYLSLLCLRTVYISFANDHILRQKKKHGMMIIDLLKVFPYL